jgi:nicotinic acid mononucleotide adenylyltransferase
MPAIEGRIDFVVMPQLDISATEIRRRVASGEPTDDLLPHGVRAVIEHLGLYR